MKSMEILPGYVGICFFFGGSSDQGSLNDRVLGGSNLMQEYMVIYVFLRDLPYDNALFVQVGVISFLPDESRWF